MIRRHIAPLLCLLPGLVLADTPESDMPTLKPLEGTRLVLLGTGNPNPDPQRMGPAVAVVADDRAYLVDCGTGVVRRANAAYKRHGLQALRPDRLDRVFVTHLHSDHTLGLDDLILTPWVMGREQPLEAHGPPGLQKMVDGLLAAYAEDIRNRLEGNQPATPEGHKVRVREVKPGQVFRDDRVTVRAFAVKHGAWKHAYGYRLDTEDRSIVISGDTVAQDSVVRACSGCDVLVHEVYARAGFDQRSKEWQAYHAASHTSGPELGGIAKRARPKLLVLYHHLLWGATVEQLLAEIRAGGYEGEIAFGNDLDTF